MSIQFNPNALNAFSNVNFGRDDAIANLGDGNGLVHNGGRLRDVVDINAY